MLWSTVLLAMVVVSCADRAPARAPDITGQITRATTGVTDGSRRITVLVEAVPNDVSGSAKAGTLLIQTDADSPRAAPPRSRSP